MVLLAHQLNMPNPAAHSAKSTVLMTRLKRGFRPMQQCRTIVNVRAAIVKRAAEQNYANYCEHEHIRQLDAAGAEETYEDESPWCSEVIMVQMVDEVKHNASHDYRRD